MRRIAVLFLSAAVQIALGTDASALAQPAQPNTDIHGEIAWVPSIGPATSYEWEVVQGIIDELETSLTPSYWKFTPKAALTRLEFVLKVGNKPENCTIELN